MVSVPFRVVVGAPATLAITALTVCDEVMVAVVVILTSAFGSLAEAAAARPVYISAAVRGWNPVLSYLAAVNVPVVLLAVAVVVSVNWVELRMDAMYEPVGISVPVMG